MYHTHSSLFSVQGVLNIYGLIYFWRNLVVISKHIFFKIKKNTGLVNFLWCWKYTCFTPPYITLYKEINGVNGIPYGKLHSFHLWKYEFDIHYPRGKVFVFVPSVVNDPKTPLKWQLYLWKITNNWRLFMAISRS